MQTGDWPGENYHLDSKVTVARDPKVLVGLGSGPKSPLVELFQQSIKFLYFPARQRRAAHSQCICL